MTAKISGVEKRLKALGILPNISRFISIITANKAVSTVMLTFVLASSIADINGSSAKAVIRVRITVAKERRKRLRFISDSFRRKCFASLSFSNSSRGLKSSNSFCSRRVSGSVPSSSLSGRRESSPVRSIDLV